MQPNQIPQNLGLALAQMRQNFQPPDGNGINPQDVYNSQMGQNSLPSFGDSQVNPQQIRPAQPPAPASYSYQPQQSQMSQMQLTPTQQSFNMPDQQQQPNYLGDSMKGFIQSLNRVNQQNKNQNQSYDPYDQSDYNGPGIYGY